MIAIWMLIAIGFSLLVALLGAWLEPALLRSRWPVRGVWIALLLSAAALPVVRAVSSPRALTPDASTQPVRTSSPFVQTDVVAPRAEPPRVGAPNVGAPSTGLTRTDLVARPALTAPSRLSSTVTNLVGRAARWDRPLLILWGTTSALLLAFLLIARARQSNVVTTGLSPECLDDETVPIVLTDSLGPAATGILHPRILLPRWALGLDPGSRALMLRHEREHLAARDPALLFVASLVVALLPWNFVLWWIAGRLRTAIELDCDARVLRRAPDVRRYAELLLLVGERAARSTPAFAHGALVHSSVVHASLLMLTARRSALRRRVDVMTRPRAGSWRRASALCLMAVVGIALLGVAMPAPRPLLSAQSVPLSSRMLFSRLLTAGQLPVVRDSAVFDMRAVLGAGALFTGHGWHPLLSPARWAPRLFESRAPRGTVSVTSGSARPATVLLYMDTPAGSPAPADTQRVVTPFILSRTFSTRALHMRSVNGDRFTVSAEIATAPGFRETVTGAHIVLDTGAPANPDRSVTWINPGRSARCMDRMPWSLREDRACP